MYRWVVFGEWLANEQFKARPHPPLHIILIPSVKKNFFLQNFSQKKTHIFLITKTPKSPPNSNRVRGSWTPWRSTQTRGHGGDPGRWRTRTPARATCVSGWLPAVHPPLGGNVERLVSIGVGSSWGMMVVIGLGGVFYGGGGRVILVVVVLNKYIWS